MFFRVFFIFFLSTGTSSYNTTAQINWKQWTTLPLVDLGSKVRPLPLVAREKVVPFQLYSKPLPIPLTFQKGRLRQRGRRQAAMSKNVIIKIRITMSKLGSNRWDTLYKVFQLKSFDFIFKNGMVNVRLKVS